MVLTTQCSISCSAQFRVIIMKYGVSYHVSNYHSLALGLGRGLYENRSIYKRMYARRVPQFVLTF